MNRRIKELYEHKQIIQNKENITENLCESCEIRFRTKDEVVEHAKQWISHQEKENKKGILERQNLNTELIQTFFNPKT